MKKFMELMRRPITIGDCVVFVLGQILVALGVLGKLKIDEMRRKKTKKDKKGYTTVKLDDLSDDGEEPTFVEE